MKIELEIEDLISKSEIRKTACEKTNEAEIRFLRGRLKFTDEDGNIIDRAPFPSMVAVYNEREEAKCTLKNARSAARPLKAGISEL